MPGDPAIVVRRAEVRDAEALARTFAAARAFAGTLQLPFPSASLWQKRIAEMQPDHHMLVAEVRCGRQCRAAPGVELAAASACG
jgi:putative acetyltransferase